MDLIKTTIQCDNRASIPDALKSSLEKYPDLQRLDIITNILTAGASVDERLAEVIHASWEYLCAHDLWSLRYESLQEFRQIVSYSETILPIIRRFKKSDKKKIACLDLVHRNWGLAATEVLPPDIAPITWSKHLLCLLAALSKWRTSEQAVALLRESIQKRPKRSRQQKGIIASDIQRVIEKIKPSETKRLRAQSPGNHEIGQTDTHSLGRLKEQGEKGKHQEAEMASWLPMPDMISLLEPSTDLLLNFEPVQSASLASPGSTNSAENILPCGCALLCFPLTVLLARPSGDDIEPSVVKQLLHWAKNISWSSICAEHLRQLASLTFGPSTEMWHRKEIIGKAEDLLGGCLVDEFVPLRFTTPREKKPFVTNIYTVRPSC